MTASTKSIADVLSDAADLIAAPGAWTQGKFERTNDDGSTCFCAMGALLAVECDRQIGQAAVALARRTMGGGVVSFNDAPERTQEEVVAKLREAAAKARAEQVA